jgi:hypothetical protein
MESANFIEVMIEDESTGRSISHGEASKDRWLPALRADDAQACAVQQLMKLRRKGLIILNRFKPLPLEL